MESTEKNKMEELIRQLLIYQRRITGILSIIEPLHNRGYLNLNLGMSSFIFSSEGEEEKILSNCESGFHSGKELRENPSLCFIPGDSFKAPEQCMGDLNLIGPWSDLYSVTAIFRTYITGENSTFMRSILSFNTDYEMRRILSVYPRDIKNSLYHIFRKGMSPNTARRYQTAAEMRSDLRFLEKIISETFFKSNIPH